MKCIIDYCIEHDTHIGHVDMSPSPTFIVRSRAPSDM